MTPDARLAGLRARLASVAASRWFYLGWALASAVLLAIAREIDPYVLAFAAMGAAAISAILFLVALLFGQRQLLWAILAGVPTLLAFLLLGTIRWA